MNGCGGRGQGGPHEEHHECQAAEAGRGGWQNARACVGAGALPAVLSGQGSFQEQQHLQARLPRTRPSGKEQVRKQAAIYKPRMTRPDE
eukprot:scaffold646297_cov45-Prasinocladus_malaysianus.AAC.2